MKSGLRLKSMIYVREKLFAAWFSIGFVSRVSSSERHSRGSGRSELAKFALVVDPIYIWFPSYSRWTLTFRQRSRWVFYGSSGFLLPGCFLADQVSSCAEAFDCTESVAAVVEDPFHTPRIAALKRRDPLHKFSNDSTLSCQAMILQFPKEGDEIFYKNRKKDKLCQIFSLVLSNQEFTELVLHIYIIYIYFL